MIKNLIIDSRDRISGTTHDFTITLPHIINNVKNVKINHIMLPHTWYNVTSDNNTFIVDMTTITLTTGNYHIYELVPEIENKLNAAGLGITFTVAYDVVLLKLIITGDSAFTMSFDSESYKMFGFKENVDYSGLLSYTSDYVVDLNPMKYVSVVIPELGLYGFNTSDTNCNYTFIVVVDENKINWLDFGKNSNYNQMVGHSYGNLFNLSIQIKDDRNRFLDLNGAEWYMNLEIEY